MIIFVIGMISCSYCFRQNAETTTTTETTEFLNNQTYSQVNLVVEGELPSPQDMGLKCLKKLDFSTFWEVMNLIDSSPFSLRKSGILPERHDGIYVGNGGFLTFSSISGEQIELVLESFELESFTMTMELPEPSFSFRESQIIRGSFPHIGMVKNENSRLPKEYIIYYEEGEVRLIDVAMYIWG